MLMKVRALPCNPQIARTGTRFARCCAEVQIASDFSDGPAHACSRCCLRRLHLHHHRRRNSGRTQMPGCVAKLSGVRENRRASCCCPAVLVPRALGSPRRCRRCSHHHCRGPCPPMSYQGRLCGRHISRMLDYQLLYKRALWWQCRWQPRFCLCCCCSDLRCPLILYDRLLIHRWALHRQSLWSAGRRLGLHTWRLSYHRSHCQGQSQSASRERRLAKSLGLLNSKKVHS
mmetsp:Transcript_5555/g.10476  ORF Transcript_5555/g.10476 Transcript_5555/m.10476 type:complete len:230 (-) Transcript_5555:177-866(-)